MIEIVTMTEMPKITPFDAAFVGIIQRADLQDKYGAQLNNPVRVRK